MWTAARGEHVVAVVVVGHLGRLDGDAHRLGDRLARRPVADVAVGEVPGDRLGRVRRCTVTAWIGIMPRTFCCTR